jgi:hypothetical protein
MLFLPQVSVISIITDTAEIPAILLNHREKPAPCSFFLRFEYFILSLMSRKTSNSATHNRKISAMLIPSKDYEAKMFHLIYTLVAPRLFPPWEKCQTTGKSPSPPTPPSLKYLCFIIFAFHPRFEFI